MDLAPGGEGVAARRRARQSSSRSPRPATACVVEVPGGDGPGRTPRSSTLLSAGPAACRAVPARTSGPGPAARLRRVRVAPPRLRGPARGEGAGVPRDPAADRRARARQLPGAAHPSLALAAAVPGARQVPPRSRAAGGSSSSAAARTSRCRCTECHLLEPELDALREAGRPGAGSGPARRAGGHARVVGPQRRARRSSSWRSSVAVRAVTPRRSSGVAALAGLRPHGRGRTAHAGGRAGAAPGAGPSSASRRSPALAAGRVPAVEPRRQRAARRGRPGAPGSRRRGRARALLRRRQLHGSAGRARALGARRGGAGPRARPRPGRRGRGARGPGALLRAATPWPSPDALARERGPRRGASGRRCSTRRARARGGWRRRCGSSPCPASSTSRATRPPSPATSRAAGEAGYRVELVQAIDLFPQTHHVEGVALLTMTER